MTQLESPSLKLKFLSVMRAKLMNFTLDEIKALLKMRDNRQQMRADVRALTLQKLAIIEKQVQELNVLREELQLLIGSCSCSQQGCPIIENIDGTGTTIKLETQLP